MSNKRKKVEFVRAITGPSIESKNEELPRYSTWNFGEGITVNPSPYFQKHEIEIDEAYVVDLINQHGGGGGGNPSAWAFYSASQDVDMNMKRITNLQNPVFGTDATPRSYVDDKLNDKQFFNKNSANQLVGNFNFWSAMAYRQEGPMPTTNPLGSADGYVAIQPNNFIAQTKGIAYQAPNYHQTGSIKLRDRGSLPLAFEVSLESRLPEHTGSISFRMSPSAASHDAAVYWSAPFFSGSRLDLFDSNNVTLPNNEPSILAALNYLDDRIESGSGGGGDSSLLTSDDANTFISASNDSLLVGFDQYSKKLVVEEIDPDTPEMMLSKSIETWDDIARDEAIWGSIDGFGSAFMRTNYAFVEDSNEKSWGFQWINNVFEGHSHQGINISQGDHRLTFATVDTSSGDFYLGSNTQDYWSRLDIRKDNIEIRASKDYNETSFKIEPSGSSTNKPLSMGNNRITNVEDPMFLQDVATKAYVDSIAGIGATIAEGELTMTPDSANENNITTASAGPLRFTRIGRTVTLSGTINVTADSAGAATAAFTGVTGAAIPVTNNTWRSTILDTSSHQTKALNIMVYPAGDFRFTVVGADAGASYRISFVMSYRSAA